MKTRSDFVSNSSSCSFFVWLQSEHDIDEFKKIVGLLKDRQASIEVYSSAEDADCHANGTLVNDQSLSNTKLFECGDYVLCDVGEDHDSWYEQRYNDMCSVFDECGYEFKFYEDPWAHMTRGEVLPVE